jgi:hypothetical protein
MNKILFSLMFGISVLSATGINQCENIEIPNISINDKEYQKILETNYINLADKSYYYKLSYKIACLEFVQKVKKNNLKCENIDSVGNNLLDGKYTFICDDASNKYVIDIDNKTFVEIKDIK